MTKKIVMTLVAFMLMATLVVVGCAPPKEVAPPPPEEVITLSVISHVPTTYPIQILTEEWAHEVEKETGGKVEFVFYPAEQLVKAKSMIDAVQTGTADIFIGVELYYSKTYPLMGIGSVPFLFKDFDSFAACTRGDVGDVVRAEYSKHNMVVLDYFGSMWGPLAFAMVDKMPRLPQDIAGQRMRVTSSLEAELMEIVGATPIFMPSPEVYTSLQRGTIDGMVVGYFSYIPRHYYEVTKYLCVNNVSWTVGALPINKDKWNTLPEGIQKVMLKTAGKYADISMERGKAQFDEEREKMEAKGTKVKLATEEELAIWKEVARPVWDKWIAEVGPEGRKMIEAVAK